MVADKTFTPNPVGYNLGLDFTAPFTYYKDHPDQKAGFSAYLQAWDPVAGKQVWKGEVNQGPTGGAVAIARARYPTWACRVVADRFPA